MKRFWPRTLFAQLMLIWAVGLVLVIALSSNLFLGERGRFGRQWLMQNMTTDIVNAVTVLEALAPADRPSMLPRFNRRLIQFSLLSEEAPMSAPPPGRPPLFQEEQMALAEAVKAQLPDHEVVWHAMMPPELPFSHAFNEHPPGPPNAPPLPDHGHAHRDHAMGSLHIQLSDASVLVATIHHFPDPGLAEGPSNRLWGALAAFVIGLAGLTWVAVRLAVRPIIQLGEAARELGQDFHRPPLPVKGSQEVRAATEAFNTMQTQLLQHMSERTRILAAISHDLQTPITRMRLRAEMIDEDPLRAKFQNDLDDMQTLVKEGLELAKSLETTEAACAIDLNALVQALVGDAQEMGWSVTLEGQVTQSYTGHLNGLRRALWNLVSNGIKFGQAVQLTLAENSTHFLIQVHDQGPGIAPEEMDKVFEPFYRAEHSRNRDTGGTGLGLSIARNLIQAQGGEITLANADAGGLIASIFLPKTDAPAR